MMAMSVGVGVSKSLAPLGSDVHEVRCGHYLRRGRWLVAADSGALLWGVWLEWRICLRREEATKERSTAVLMVEEIERAGFFHGQASLGL